MSSATHTFSAELQLLIDREMAEGKYETVEQLLRQALDYWSEHRDTIAALDQAVEELDAGLGRPWEEVDREFRARYGLPDTR